MAELSQELINTLFDTASALADQAGQVILPYFRSPELQADNKQQDGFDPVTAADRASEKAMRALLAELRPQDGILGEEFGPKDSESGLTWVLDPIDGTRGFLSGTPTWGVLISVADETGPVLGLIEQPYTGERFFGGPGRANWTGHHGGGVCQTRTTTDLANAILFSTFPEVGTPAEGAAFAKVAEQVQLTRYGCDCYAYALLAAGQIDLVIEAGLQPYDIQAPIAVITAAGGIVTDWTGGPAHHGGRVLAAANKELHAQALALLANTP
jgi:histidinol phosphatase-like enzyme (inositol monophosphatase family)